MKKVLITIIAIVAVSVYFTSCVPTRKYEEMDTRRVKCEKEQDSLKTYLQKTNTQNTELTSTNALLNKTIQQLCIDTAIIGKQIRTTNETYLQLKHTYDILFEKNQQLLNNTTSETEKILAKLQKTQEELLKKEDELRKLERELNKRKADLDKLSKEIELNKLDLEKQKKELELKGRRIAELERILRSKDSTLLALKNKLMEALMGFKDKGLTIEQKNGKIYISMEENLLFASGSYQVEPKGIEALKKVAKVLETNQDVYVLVEGHTDTDPYKGTGLIKDNWDLSVIRATSIVKIIVNNSKVSPKRLTAAGRGEYMPLNTANTKEAKAKNRRTELILTPKLDELFQIIENN